MIFSSFLFLAYMSRVFTVQVFGIIIGSKETFGSELHSAGCTGRGIRRCPWYGMLGTDCDMRASWMLEHTLI